MYLSKNFTLEEFIKSHVADKYNIPNEPDVINIRNIVYLVNAILQPLRDRINEPIIITSGFRSHELNSHEEIGGKENSHHLAYDRYAAADIKSNKYTPRQLMDITAQMKLPVEQAIDEGTWFHVSSCRPSMEYLEVIKDSYLNNIYKVITSLITTKACIFSSDGVFHIMVSWEKLQKDLWCIIILLVKFSFK